MVCSAQAVHLSCVEISTISKQTESSSTWASSPRSTIGCVRNDSYAYGTLGANRAPILLQDYHYLPNRPNLASTWASSHRSTIGCVPNNFRAYGTFGANRAPILHQHLRCLTETWFDMTHVTEEFHRTCLKRFPILCYIRHKPCTYLALRLPLSPNGPNPTSTWDSSPKSTIRCVQNDL
jgi:hypothetical protein